MNVFFVPHSHADPGWLYTYETYYNRQVTKILRNVFNELKSSKSKKFTWCETSFLQPFYQNLTASDKKDFEELLRSGQLEIVGGGWVQHDETLTTYNM